MAPIEAAPRLRFSRYVQVIPTHSEFMLVDLRGRSATNISSQTLEILKRAVATGEPSSEIRPLWRHLVEAGFLVAEDFDELVDVAQRSLWARAGSRTFAAIVAPTIACNMSCHYCFEGTERPEKQLSDETMVRLGGFIRDALKERSCDRLHVRWFGGEPLLALETIEQLTVILRRVCKDSGASYGADAVTNGFELSRATVDRLVANGVGSVQITLDGAQRTHDKIRRTASGEGSFERLLENITGAAEQIAVRVRIHVAPYNIAEIPDLLKLLVERGLQERLASVYFAPLFDYRQDRKELAFAGTRRLFLSSRDFADAQVELYKVALGLGLAVPDPLDVDYGVCTALRENTVVVNPDGTLAKCYLDAGDASESFATLGDDETERPDNLTKWRRSLFLTDDECRSCDFVPVCLGGCAKQGEHATDKRMVCTPLRYNADRLLPLYYADRTGAQL